MRYLITFSYDGTKFHGFQRQNTVKNVQGELEQVLSTVLEEAIVIKGSGRTDAGVHAHCRGAHFDTNRKITRKDKKRINKQLNGEIIIKSYRKVREDFHARRNVLEKKYVYQINNGAFDPNKEGYFYQIRYNLDLKAMKECLKLFVGTHDFRNFVSGPRIDYTTTIYKTRLKKKGSNIYLEFVGIGFYRYMVRHLVGAVLDVGRGKKKLADVATMLDGSCIFQGSVAPASGLYLEKIKYDL